MYIIYIVEVGPTNCIRTGKSNLNVVLWSACMYLTLKQSMIITLPISIYNG